MGLQSTDDEGITLDSDEVKGVCQDLENLRNFLNNTVHGECEYNIYVYLMDTVDSLERVFDKE